MIKKCSDIICETNLKDWKRDLELKKIYVMGSNRIESNEKAEQMMCSVWTTKIVGKNIKVWGRPINQTDGELYQVITGYQMPHVIAVLYSYAINK